MSDGPGSKVRALRLAQERTLEDVADGANVHRNTLIRIEQGHRQPSVILYCRVAHQLGHRVVLIPEDTPLREGDVPVCPDLAAS